MHLAQSVPCAVVVACLWDGLFYSLWHAVLKGLFLCTWSNGKCREEKKKPSLSRLCVMFNQSECRTAQAWFTVVLSKSSPVWRCTDQISVPHWLHCISSVNFGGTFHMTKDYWIAHRSCWLCCCLLFLYGYLKGLILKPANPAYNEFV